jgi:hypothetical protein
VDYVGLFYKRNRGWPSPENSWGLTPMFGPDGWCASCGTPLNGQIGPLTLRRSGLTVVGAWVPNWRFDTICLPEALADEIRVRFNVELREVAWARSSPERAFQMVIPSTPSAWFAPDQLRERALDRHGVAGASCPACGIWRWMPLSFDLLPALRINAAWGDLGAVASPEWFGAGCQSFRQVLFHRPLAELIASASPRDFKLQEVRSLG